MGANADSPRCINSEVTGVAGRPPDAALIEWTANRIAEVRSSAEGREGVAAFLQKRKPNWLLEN